jgi:hypothetical protein
MHGLNFQDGMPYIIEGEVYLSRTGFSFFSILSEDKCETTPTIAAALQLSVSVFTVIVVRRLCLY